MTIKELTEKFDKYVSLERFTPVERIVYGFTGIILSAFGVALVALIIRK